VPPLAWAAAALLSAAALTQGTFCLWQSRFRTRLSVTGIEAQGFALSQARGYWGEPNCAHGGHISG